MSNNSLSNQLENLNLNQLNLLKINSAFLEALTSNKENVSTEIETVDGQMQKIVIPSNVSLGNNIKRLDKSLKQLSGLSDNKSAIVSDDGSFKEIFVSNKLKTPKEMPYADIGINTEINVSNNPIIEKFISPLTSVEMTIPKGIDCKKVKIYKILLKEGDPSILEEGQTYQQVMDTVENTNNTVFSEIEYILDVEKPNTRFYGDFNVINTETSLNGEIQVEVESILYNDSLNSVENSRELEVGDKLLNGEETTEYEITGIQDTILTLSIINGVGSISIGENQLTLNNTQYSNPVVMIPVRMLENSAIFLSEINENSQVSGVKSKSRIFNSENFTVSENGQNVGFNDYFQRKVADVSKYFSDLLKQNLMPVSYGKAPEKPNLEVDNFEVVQINDHITDTPTLNQIKKLSADKESIKSELEAKNNSISKISKKITKGNYAIASKAQLDKNKMEKLTSEAQQKTKMLSTATKQIKSLLKTNVSKAKPKYRVRGFWGVQQDLQNDEGDKIEIVQYQVRYRYLSPEGKTANTKQFAFKDNDTENSDKIGVFTPWEYRKTEPLERKMIDGKMQWVKKSENDSDASNINQLDVPINSGESVEVQIKAICEAGYPDSPLTSSWSDVMRMDFPENLSQDDEVEIINKDNEEDSLMVKISEEFENKGITEHINKSYKEQGKYYAHDANDIASGYVTDEGQTTISMFEHTKRLENKINSLEEIVNRRYAQLTLQMLDEETSDTSDIKNNTTINLFAGYYTDMVDLSESDNYGDIAEKTFYLKITNRNAQTADIISLEPGNPTTNTDNEKYNNVPLYLLGENEIFPQKRGQIFYNRNIDVTNDESLYINNEEESNVVVDQTDIKSNAEDAEKTIVHQIGPTVERVALVEGANLNDYVAMTTDHPIYNDYINTNNNTLILEEFDRLKNFNGVYRNSPYQNEFGENNISRFSTNDKYLVGKNSLGSALYTSINDISSYQVEGIDTGSSKMVYSGEQESILIPIVFQFRMTDALGNPNGNSSLNENSQFEYQKKIGFDLILKGSKFSFDVVVSSKFRPTNSAVNKFGISQVPSNTLSNPNVG